METKVEIEMNDDKGSSKRDRRGGKGMADNGVTGGIFGLAFIGAAVYYIQHATTFWMGVLGFLKALVWPALVMYRVLELLAMK
jgi:hypothetical protein